MRNHASRNTCERDHESDPSIRSTGVLMISVTGVSTGMVSHSLRANTLAVSILIMWIFVPFLELLNQFSKLIWEMLSQYSPSLGGRASEGGVALLKSSIDDIFFATVLNIEYRFSTLGSVGWWDSVAD